MTDPYFGRALPVHFYMVSLAGWGRNNADAEFWDTENSDPGLLRDDLRAATEICAGRIGLVRMCLIDLGFDVLAWRRLLMEGPHPEFDPKYGTHGYMHPYAVRPVDRVVREGAANPHRPRQIAIAADILPEQLSHLLAWYQREWRDPEEPLWLAAIEGWPFDRGG